MFFRTKRSGPREYLQIVRNWREDGRVKQEVVATVGRRDMLSQSGAIESLLRSGARFSEKLAVFDVYEKGEASATDTKIGIPLVFGHLWDELGIRKVIEALAGGRQFPFPLERAVFLTVLHRLTETGSDRAAEEWQKDYRIEGTKDIFLHHLYRAMAWLGEPLPPRKQAGKSFSPRCVKDLVEEQLFERRKDLLSPSPSSTRRASTSRAREARSASGGTQRISGRT